MNGGQSRLPVKSGRNHKVAASQKEMSFLATGDYKIKVKVSQNCLGLNDCKLTKLPAKSGLMSDVTFMGYPYLLHLMGSCKTPSNLAPALAPIDLLI